MAKITHMDTRTSTEVVILQRSERKKALTIFLALLELHLFPEQCHENLGTISLSSCAGSIHSQYFNFCSCLYHYLI